MCRELVPRLRSKRGDPAELQSARTFLEWLLDDNYIFMGTVAYRRRAGRDARADRRDGDRRLHRPHAAARGVPGRVGARRVAPRAAAAARADPRDRLLRQRLRDLPPGADRRPDGARVGRGRQAGRASRCCSAASRAAPSRSAPTASRCSRRSTTASWRRAARSRARTRSARCAPSSTTSPRPSSSTPGSPTSSA